MRMDKNNNYAIVRKLAWCNIRTGSRTSLLTSLIIALTSMLITAMILQTTGIVNSQKKILERAQQVIYMNLTESEKAELASDKRISSAIATKTGQGVVTHDVFVIPVYLEPPTWDMDSVQPTEGRMAEKAEEVVLDKATLRAFNLPEALNTQITINFLNSPPETFTVVGLTDIEADGSTLERHLLYFSSAYANTGPQLANIPWSLMVRINGGATMNGNELKSMVYRLGEDYGIEYQNINPHDHYIRLRTIQIQTLLTYIVIALAMIMISMLVIYSIFYLSVAGRIRQFGQLRTIGMTPKQLRSMVKREGWLLWMMSTPAGFALASLIMLLFGPENGWALQNNLAALAASSLVCGISVWLSVKKPAVIASSASPIEAARFQSWQNEPERTNTAPRTLTPFGLAKLNFSRSIKKQIFTMLSLAVGGILFMMATIFVNGFQLEAYSRQGELTHSEYVVYFDYNTENSLENGSSMMQLKGLLGNAFQSRILQLPDVEDVKSYHGVSTRFRWNGIEGDDLLNPFTRTDASVLQKYLVDGTADYDKLVESEGVYIGSVDLWKELLGKAPQVGDEIECTFYNGKTQTVRLKVAGLGNNKIRQELIASSWLMIPKETADKLFGDMDTTRMLTIAMENNSHTQKQDEQMISFFSDYPQLELNTLSERMKIDSSSFVKIKAGFIAAAGFVVLFSLVNLLNTLLSGLLARQQQLAMLSALGMTKIQTSKMLYYENLILTFVNLAATLIFGTLAGYGFCQLLPDFGIKYIQFNFPFYWFVLYAIVAVCIPILITWICLKVFYRESLIERLRNSMTE